MSIFILKESFSMKKLEQVELQNLWKKYKLPGIYAFQRCSKEHDYPICNSVLKSEYNIHSICHNFSFRILEADSQHVKFRVFRKYTYGTRWARIIEDNKPWIFIFELLFS